MTTRCAGLRPDALDGRDGVDIGEGGVGNDTCLVELRMTCEL